MAPAHSSLMSENLAHSPRPRRYSMVSLTTLSSLIGKPIFFTDPSGDSSNKSICLDLTIDCDSNYQHSPLPDIGEPLTRSVSSADVSIETSSINTSFDESVNSSVTSVFTTSRDDLYESSLNEGIDEVDNAVNLDNAEPQPNNEERDRDHLDNHWELDAKRRKSEDELEEENAQETYIKKYLEGTKVQEDQINEECEDPKELETHMNEEVEEAKDLETYMNKNVEEPKEQDNQLNGKVKEPEEQANRQIEEIQAKNDQEKPRKRFIVEMARKVGNWFAFMKGNKSPVEMSIICSDEIADETDGEAFQAKLMEEPSDESVIGDIPMDETDGEMLRSGDKPVLKRWKASTDLRTLFSPDKNGSSDSWKESRPCREHDDASDASEHGESAIKEWKSKTLSLYKI